MEVVTLYDCVECGEVITNPISEERLALEFRTWLAETDESLEQRFAEEYVSRRGFMNTAVVGQKCILTNRHVDLCPYCATAQFIEWLDGQTVRPQLLEWALGFFLTRQDEHYVRKGLQGPTRRGVRLTLDPRARAGHEVVA